MFSKLTRRQATGGYYVGHDKSHRMAAKTKQNEFDILIKLTNLHYPDLQATNKMCQLATFVMIKIILGNFFFSSSLNISVSVQQEGNYIIYPFSAVGYTK